MGGGEAARAPAPPPVQKRLTDGEREHWRMVDRMLSHILAKVRRPGPPAPCAGGRDRGRGSCRAAPPALLGRPRSGRAARLRVSVALRNNAWDLGPVLQAREGTDGSSVGHACLLSGWGRWVRVGTCLDPMGAMGAQHPLPGQGAGAPGGRAGAGDPAAQAADPLASALGDAAGGRPAGAGDAAAPGKAEADGGAAQDGGGVPRVQGGAAGAEAGQGQAGSARAPVVRARVGSARAASGTAADAEDRPPGRVPPGLKRQRSRR